MTYTVSSGTLNSSIPYYRTFALYLNPVIIVNEYELVVSETTRLMAIFSYSLGKLVQNVSIQDFIGVEDDGGGDDNWSCKTCQAPVRT